MRALAAGSGSSRLRPVTRGPARSRPRLVGLDVARFLALVGMIATHVLDSRTASGDLTAVQWLAGGRASALFAVLAGVGVALISGGARPLRGVGRARVSAGLAVRALLIGAIGLWLGGLETGIAVILTYYAVLFVLGLPFLGLTAAPLFGLAAAWAVAAPVASQLIRPELPPRQYASPALDQLADPARLLGELTFTGYYPAVPWLTYLLLGMALGRLDLGSRRVMGQLAAGGLMAAAGATVLSGLLTTSTFTAVELDTASGGMYGQTPFDDGWRWLLVVAPHSTTPFDLVQTAGSAVLAIGLCLLLVAVVGDAADRTGAGPRAERTLQVLFGAGAMTLSLYTLHVLMRTDALPPAEVPGSFVWHVLVVGWVGAAFAALSRRGPLETVVGHLPRLLAGRGRRR